MGQLSSDLRPRKENKQMLTTALTALLFPGILFCLFLVINVVHVSHHSSRALSAVQILMVIGIWLVVATPLCALGACLGSRSRYIRPQISNPDSPRPIPRQPIFLRSFALVLMTGVVPFGNLFLISMFVLKSVWSSDNYIDAFGYELSVLGYVLISAAAQACLTCFMLLIKQNHRWWWASFYSGLGLSTYFFLYSINIELHHLTLEGAASLFIYYTYILMVAIVMFLAIGAVSFLVTWAFVVGIYRNLKKTGFPEQAKVVIKEKPAILRSKPKDVRIRRVEEATLLEDDLNDEDFEILEYSYGGKSNARK